jgi:DNA-binding NarL/FixJ family response regulator
VINESAPRVTADPHLTEREAQILHLLATGRTNQQIGNQLRLATGTIRDHVTQVYRKLGVATRPQAAVRAIELGLRGT